MVVDAAGHLMGALRCTDALWVTAEIAQAKANTAVAFRASTAELKSLAGTTTVRPERDEPGTGEIRRREVQCPLSSKVLWWVRWGLVAVSRRIWITPSPKLQYGPSTQPR